MRFLNDDSDITAGIDFSIRKAIHKSIENKNVENFHILNHFVRRVLRLCIIDKSIKHFQQYITIPSYYYNISFHKKLNDNSFEQMHKMCSELASLHLKEIIWLDIGLYAKKTKEIETRKMINQFYYWAFYGFNNLLYLIVKNNDIRQFQYALDEYEQISNMVFSQNYDLKFKLKNLQRENLEGKNNDIINVLKEEYSVASQFEKYERHVLLGIKYWIFFLYQIDKISEESALDFVKMIKVVYSDTDEVLNDILYFRGEGSHIYMGWSEWDYTERRSGKVYSPPNPYEWLTLGFMVDQIRENKLFINLDEYNPEEITHVRFLYDGLKENSEYLLKNFEKWKKILKMESSEQLLQNSENILSRFAELKRKSIGHTETIIASAQLSNQKIEIFKQAIGKTWKAQARINNLFKKTGAIEHVINDDIKLKCIGQRTFFEKAKMMFIEGDHYQMIYGIDRIGGEIGRWEDTEFFSTIFRSDHSKISGPTAVQVINNAIEYLKNNNITPDLILVAPEVGYRELMLSNLFVSKSHLPIEEGEIQLFNLGTYDGIPVYSSYTELLKKRVLVCNFKNAFKMRFKTNPDWYDNELYINVKEVTDEEAKRRLESQPDKWKKTEDGIKISDEDALTLIKTSVIIEYWTTLDFVILDKESFIIGYIKTEIPLT